MSTTAPTPATPTPNPADVFSAPTEGTGDAAPAVEETPSPSAEDPSADTSAPPSEDPPHSVDEEAAPAAPADAGGGDEGSSDSEPRSGGRTSGRDEPQVLKDAYYVRVKLPDERSQFFPATDYINRPMPFQSPLATCSMRSFDNGVVAFSLLMVTKRTAQRLSEMPIRIPVGPLTRLMWRSGELGELSSDQLYVERMGGPERPYRLALHRDDNNVGRVELLDGEDAGLFELGRGAEKIALYTASPRLPRKLAVGFIGHLGKPGATDSVERAAARAINSLLGVGEFHGLVNIETMNVPPPPTAGFAAPVRIDEDVSFEVPVFLYTSPQDTNPASGTVLVSVDLEQANINTDPPRMLLKAVNPQGDVAETFEEYRRTFEDAVQDALMRVLGADDYDNVCYEITLGEIDSRGLDRMREAGTPLSMGIDIAPGQFRFRDAELQQTPSPRPR